MLGTGQSREEEIKRSEIFENGFSITAGRTAMDTGEGGIGGRDMPTRADFLPQVPTELLEGQALFMYGMKNSEVSK